MQTRLQTRVRVPPPPRRDGTPVSPPREMYHGQENDGDFVQESVMEHPPSIAPNRRVHDDTNEEWLLRVRIPSTAPSTIVLSIHVTPEMTARTLAACLQQSMPFPQQQPIVGLFQESRAGHFYTLEHVLQTKEREVIYSVQWTRPPPSQAIPWYQQPTLWWLTLFSLPPLFWILRYYSPIVLYLVQYSTIWLYQTMVHIPLIELYRNGPWMVGWEGTPLPHICSRITYHGDEVFWSRNLDECQRIFLQKQEAWLNVARPLWWMVLLGLFSLIVRWWVASLRRPPLPVDRDMVETYRAWQVLLQQASKMFHPPPPQQHVKATQGHIPHDYS